MRGSGSFSFSITRRLLALALLASCAPAQTVTGRVLERVGDQRVPLRKALVSAGSPDGQQTFAATRTDDQGRYSLAGGLAGRLLLSAEKFGYFAVSAGGKKQPDLSIHCVETQCGPFDFELVKGGILAGTVVDDLNEPVAMAHVWVLKPSPEATDAAASQGEARTDDLGRFRIIGLPEGLYELHGAAGGRGGDTTIRTGPILIEIAAGEEIKALSLTFGEDAGAAFTVSGRVAGVDLSPLGDHSLWLRPLRRQLEAGPRYGSRMYRLGRDGSFTIEEVPPGDYVFTYGHNPRAGLDQRFALGIVAVEGEMRGLTLQPLDPSGFRGTVESDGSELPNQVSLDFVRADRSGISARADAAFPNYTFRQTELLPGVYNLSVHGHDFYIRTVRIGNETAGPRGIAVQSSEIRDIILILSSEFAVVRGRVKPSHERRADETAAAHYRVGLEGPDGVISVQADQGGVFAFERLTPGSYRICAWSDRTDAEVRRPKLWESAGESARSFPVEPGTEIEIDLTAVE